MPPKKNQKMSLNDFLADDSTGKTSWADEMDDFPTISAPRESSYRRGGDYLSSVPDRVDRDRMGPSSFERPERSYPPREEVPLPTKPPFTAFIGNLSYDVTEGEIEDYFAPAKVLSVRIVTSHDGRPKGFGYVEFETLDGLKDALTRNGTPLANRSVRVSVAEPPKSGSTERSMAAPSAADDASQWRRSAPLPQANDAPPRGGYGGRSERPSFARAEGGSSGFDNMDVAGGARSGFGSKFQPSAPPREGPPRTPREPAEPSQGDVASDWRTGKPVESRRPSGPGPYGEPRGPSFRRSDATDVDEKYASQERMGFGSKFSPSAPTPESPGPAKRGFGFSGERRGSGNQGGAGGPAAGPSDGASNWRSVRKPAGGSPTPAAAAPPAERRKLELKPRTADPAAVAAPASSSGASTSKPNPFGNAKPVDASERERQIEEKLAQRERERQEELKAKKERQRAEKEKAASAATNAEGANAGDAASDAAAAATASTEDEATKAAPNAAAVATKPARATPPTGAWGGGRKPAGALTKEQERAKANAATTAAAAAANGKGDATEGEVQKVAEQVAKTDIKA
ncbi:Eukaryotic translation initiation factor 4B [Thecaphora frezii]